MDQPHPIDEASDEALLAATGRGDAAAFGRLFDRYGGPLLRYLRRVVGDAAEDALQQTLIDAYRGAATFRGDGSARSWLFTLARRRAHRMGRGERAEASADTDVEALDHAQLFELGRAAGWGADPETLAVRARQRQVLEDALAALPAEQREVIVLRDVEQLTGPEAAAILGLELAAMKSRLHRARLQLAGELRRQGMGDDHA